MPTIQKIRYADCDAQEIVFNANYPKYWDDALTDWLWDAGFVGEHLGGIGAEMVTARMEIDFKSSARLGDSLETSVVVERFGNTSMTVGIVTRRLGDEAVIATGRQVLVFVDPETFRPTTVPDQVRAALGGESAQSV